MTTERNPQAHTPGPWRVSTAVIMDGFNPVMGPGGVIIALVSTLAGNRMDARLIASAPELLAACHHAAMLFRKYEQMHMAKGTEDGKDKAERNRDAAEAMEAAISKATAPVKAGA